jgi:cell wall-associated NlpC family hydrolase
VLTIVASLVAAPAAMAQTTTGGTDIPSGTPAAAPAPSPVTGGAAYGEPNPATTQVVPTEAATVLPTGYAAAPASAPQEVKDAIAAANEIVGKPYVYGGGHNREFKSSGYDCSGTVSYALHGGDLLKSPLDSGSFMRWGKKGRGHWITVYANGGHAWMKIAGLRLDTSAAGERRSSGEGPRWRSNLRGGRGFTKRHPRGF